MQNRKRFEFLRSLSPEKALQAWIDGEFGIGDEPALCEAIRKDPDIALSDDEIIQAMWAAIDEELSADACLVHLARLKRSEE